MVDGFLQYLESVAAAQVELPTIGPQADATLSSKYRPSDSTYSLVSTLANLGLVVGARMNGYGNSEEFSRMKIRVVGFFADHETREILRRLVVILDRVLLHGPVSERCECRHLDVPTQAKAVLSSLRDGAAAQQHQSSTDDLPKLLQEADRVMQGLVRYPVRREGGDSQCRETTGGGRTCSGGAMLGRVGGPARTEFGSSWGGAMLRRSGVWPGGTGWSHARRVEPCSDGWSHARTEGAGWKACSDGVPFLVMGS